MECKNDILEGTVKAYDLAHTVSLKTKYIYRERIDMHSEIKHILHSSFF
jgi:hypothetical protein